MGVCSSCLGLGRRAADSDVRSQPAAAVWPRQLTASLAQAPDRSRLLSDPYQQYGSIRVAAARSDLPQPDPDDIRRQRDALERICAQTSESVAPSLLISHALLTHPLPANSSTCRRRTAPTAPP